MCLWVLFIPRISCWDNITNTTSPWWLGRQQIVVSCRISALKLFIKKSDSKPQASPRASISIRKQTGWERSAQWNADKQTERACRRRNNLPHGFFPWVCEFQFFLFSTPPRTGAVNRLPPGQWSCLLLLFPCSNRQALCLCISLSFYFFRSVSSFFLTPFMPHFASLIDSTPIFL